MWQATALLKSAAVEESEAARLADGAARRTAKARGYMLTCVCVCVCVCVYVYLSLSLSLSLCVSECVRLSE